MNVTMEITGIRFSTSIDADNGSMTKRDIPEVRSHFRFALVTVKVSKPAGMQLTVAACDLTLHYFHADHSEAAPCIALSTWNKVEDEDRPLTFGTLSGDSPGFVKKTTGVRASEATAVYFDAVFDNIEPDITNVWLCVAQPSTETPFKSKGWSP